MENLETLKRQRTTIKSRATRFKTFIENYEHSIENRLILEARLEKFNESWQEYHVIQTQIDALLPQMDIEEREGFENVFFNVQAKARSKLVQSQVDRLEIQPNLQASNSGQNILNVHANQTSIRLPVISLPNFNGSYEQWQQFHDTFIALVDGNPHLDAVQKFHYLKSALSGSAAQTIHSLQITNENYPIALELLTKRFQNTRLTVHHHVHELFNLSPMPRESAELLRTLSDGFQKHLRVLQQLKEPTDKWDTLIIYLIVNKLDSATKKEWELKVIQDKWSTTDQLIKFLNTRCEFLEALNPTHVKVVGKTLSQRSGYNCVNKGQGATLTHVATNDTSECVFCKQAHRIHTCKIFKDLSVESRRNEVKRLNLCYNCLSSNHVSQKCTSRTCKHCSKKHHTLLHTNERSNIVNQEPTSSDKTSTNANNGKPNNQACDATGATSMSMKVLNIDSCKSEILLSTAIVYIRDNAGKFHKIRALLDNGSQSNFITKNTCQRLGLKLGATKHTISCLNVLETHTIETTRATIASMTTSYETNINLLVVNQITRSIPSKPINTKSLSLPQNLELADPIFYKPQGIDVLLGASIFWDILEVDRIQLGTKQPILQLTKLGWLLCGQIGVSSNSRSHTHHSVCGFVRNEDLQSQMERFWHIEDMPGTKLLSAEEAKCEEIFRRECTRTTDGRFQVSLPFRNDPNHLGESKANALKRLHHMERRFRRNPDLQTEYTNFMNEYLRLGHMSMLPDSENLKINYLPHHAVIKRDSTSTKLRVVFDASSPTTSGRSLNDCLMVGPTIQSELFEILVRFRQHPYVLTGDIVKMYRQVMVKPEHRLYQCILWRTDSDQPAMTFALNTVTYGVAAAPYLAIRSLRQLAHDSEGKYSRAAMVIARDFYVDDMITGTSSIDELLETKARVTEILGSAGFELTKFCSNLALDQDKSQDSYGFTDTKILGLLWKPGSDLMRYEVNCDIVPNIITKRIILSLVTQIFDPLGLIGPVIIKAKILMQLLWQLKTDWDTPLPETLRMTWLSYYQQLPLINRLVIPRHVIVHNPVDIQLHGFCDASQTAYGACIYIRSVDNNGRVKVQLLTAKSRVSPLKTISLPRLELCGAVLLANLYQKVSQALTCTIQRCYFWTDSMIVLAWIKGEPSRWQVYVGNRIAEIQRLTDQQDWLHIRSEHNPADVISRGVLPEQLLNTMLWWEGPPWLKENQSRWPETSIHIPSEIPEARVQSFALLHVKKSLNLFDRYSSLIKLKRVVAWCMRFKTNCMLSKTKSSKTHGPLACEELQRSMNILIKLHQIEAFPSELHHLQQGKAINPQSKILSLSPIIDQDGLLRVGGRLRNASLPYSQKHPILLSSTSALTDLIIRDQHLNNFHIGPQLLLTTLREIYWIIHARSAIRRILNKCVLCFRMRPRSAVQQMADLPAVRVVPSRAFTHTGVDYAGPFNIKISRNKSGKAYLCLFICMATKAVHLELVSDLSTDAFLNALKRFISRRGKCKTVLSDNGKNFLGASNMLRQVGELLTSPEHRAKTIDFTSNQGITWNFIPPHSPHMGGLWEANIKAVKTHLKTVINDTLLSFEELYTVFTQIEAILNSRPLCPLSNSPDDLEVLTPGHFLVGTSLSALPEESVLDIPINRTNRYQLLTHLQQAFWRRWTREYVTQMQQRTKWKFVARNDEIQIGKLALIRDENTPPLKWNIGRICEIHPGPDGLVRVVSLKTAGRITQRSLPKICVLPIDC